MFAEFDVGAMLVGATDGVFVLGTAVVGPAEGAKLGAAVRFTAEGAVDGIADGAAVLGAMLGVAVGSTARYRRSSPSESDTLYRTGLQLACAVKMK